MLRPFVARTDLQDNRPVDHFGRFAAQCCFFGTESPGEDAVLSFFSVSGSRACPDACPISACSKTKNCVKKKDISSRQPRWFRSSRQEMQKRHPIVLQRLGEDERGRAFATVTAGLSRAVLPDPNDPMHRLGGFGRVFRH